MIFGGREEKGRGGRESPVVAAKVAATGPSEEGLREAGPGIWRPACSFGVNDYRCETSPGMPKLLLINCVRNQEQLKNRTSCSAAWMIFCLGFLMTWFREASESRGLAGRCGVRTYVRFSTRGLFLRHPCGVGKNVQFPWRERVCGVVFRYEEGEV